MDAYDFYNLQISPPNFFHYYLFLYGLVLRGGSSHLHINCKAYMESAELPNNCPLKQAKRKVEPYLDCCCSLGYAASHETLPDIYLILFSILVCLLSFPMNRIKKASC